MTIDEAIKHCLEVAEENDLAAGTYELLAENNHNAYEKLTAETNSSRCAECAEDHRQLAEWLTELKDSQPVKYGHWDYSEKENGECAWYFCSECDEPAEQLYDGRPLLSEFYPHCGARMDGDTNE